MTLVGEYREARRAEDVARLRRVLALRAMVASGMSQQVIADALGVTQPAVSQQLKAGSSLDGTDLDTLLAAAVPVLKELAAEHGYRRLAVFGSVARGEARPDSDIDLLVEPPADASSFDFVDFKELLERILGWRVDLVSWGGLKPGLDDDIRRDAVEL